MLYWLNKLHDRYSGGKFTVTLTSTTPQACRLRDEVQSVSNLTKSGSLNVSVLPMYHQELGDNSRSVTHFHCTAWPDHCVLDNAIW